MSVGHHFKITLWPSAILLESHTSGGNESALKEPCDLYHTSETISSLKRFIATLDKRLLNRPKKNFRTHQNQKISHSCHVNAENCYGRKTF